MSKRERDNTIASLERLPSELRSEYERAEDDVRDARNAYESAVRRYLAMSWEWDFVRDDERAPRWQLDGALMARDRADAQYSQAHERYVNARDLEFHEFMRVLDAVHSGRVIEKRPAWAAAA